MRLCADFVSMATVWPLVGLQRRIFGQKKPPLLAFKRRHDYPPDSGERLPKLGETSRIRNAEPQADIAVRDDSDDRETLEF